MTIPPYIEFFNIESMVKQQIDRILNNKWQITEGKYYTQATKIAPVHCSQFWIRLYKGQSIAVQATMYITK